MTATRPKADDQMVVYDFSDAPPDGAIDGTEELLSDAEQAALHDWYATHPRPKPVYQRLDAGAPERGRKREP